jgi:hypothetical protein
MSEFGCGEPHPPLGLAIERQIAPLDEFLRLMNYDVLQNAERRYLPRE